MPLDELQQQKEQAAAASQKAPLDICALIKANEGRNYELHSKHINPANTRTLKTIGFDRCYVQAQGP